MKEFEKNILSEIKKYGTPIDKSNTNLKFQCKKTCGDICCTKSSLKIGPTEILKIVKAIGSEFILQQFPAVIPIIGTQSLLPILYKPLMMVCPFMETKTPDKLENIEKTESICILHDRDIKPFSCKTYPFGRVTSIDPDTGDTKVIPIKLHNNLCPKEAFEEGENISKTIEEIEKIGDQSVIKLVKEIQENLDDEIKDHISKAPIHINIYYGIQFLKLCEKIDKDTIDYETIIQFYENTIIKTEKEIYEVVNTIQKYLINSAIDTMEIIGALNQDEYFKHMMAELLFVNSIDKIIKEFELLNNPMFLNPKIARTIKISNRTLTLAKIFYRESKEIPQIIEQGIKLLMETMEE